MLLIRTCIIRLPPIMGIIVQVNSKLLYVWILGCWYVPYTSMLTTYNLLRTGFESPREWEDHHRIFGVDGPDIQYTVS